MTDDADVSVMGWSSTLVNVSPCTRPSYVRNSLVFIKMCTNSCEESFMLLESMRGGITRECPSESLESRNDLLGMVCGWDAFVEEGSAIDTSLIQHSLLECTGPVFC